MRKRIFIVGLSDDLGGVESYIKNIGARLEFEIVYSLRTMIIDGVVWKAPVNRHNPLKYYMFWRRFFKENKFDVIYYNTCDIVSIDMLKFARDAGVPVRIIHAHSTGNQAVFRGLRKILQRWRERRTRKAVHNYATHFFACSKSAGDWMFDGRNYTIIKNGIDISKYKYSDDMRQRVTSDFSKIGKPVVACIGRLDSQKNPFFSLEIFKQICKLNEDAQCLFIGNGEHRESLERLVHETGFSDRIIFTGGVHNVNEWLSYIDCVLMPSLFEGLPFALVEAQAAGIHCLVSDTVSTESNITGLVEYIGLAQPAAKWAAEALRLAALPRVDISDRLIDAGYSIEHTAETVTDIINKALPS